MKLYILYGVKTADFEEARRWVAEACGFEAMGRANEYNGNYYSFGPFGGERLKLISGTCNDEDGAYPAERNFTGWKLLLRLDNTMEQSPILAALDREPQKFEKLRSESAGP